MNTSKIIIHPSEIIIYRNTRITDLIIQLGFASEEQVEEALGEKSPFAMTQLADGPQKEIGNVLVEAGVCCQKQIDFARMLLEIMTGDGQLLPRFVPPTQYRVKITFSIDDANLDFRVGCTQNINEVTINLIPIL